MSYRLELYPSNEGHAAVLSQEEVRPSSLIVPQHFALVAFRAANLHDRPEPGSMTDSGIAIPTAGETAAYGGGAPGLRVDYDKCLDEDESETLDDFMELTFKKSCQLLEDGHDGIGIVGYPAGMTEERAVALQAMGQKLALRYVGRSSQPMSENSASEEDLHIGQYL